MRKVKGWTRRGEAAPPTERTYQKSAPEKVAREISKRLRSRTHYPLLGGGLVLIKPYVEQRWTPATAKSKLAEKVRFLAKKWGWKLGTELRKEVLSCGGGKAGEGEWVCKLTALQEAHGKEYGL